MSGQGPYGVAGPTGPTGMTGRRGLQGTPVGATGSSQFGAGGCILYSVPASTTITVTTSTYGTHYLIPTAYPTTAITLPASMSAGDAGAFWVFQNNTDGVLTITLTNGTASYRGNSSTTTVYIGTYSGFALVYSGSGTSYIVL
jgi:hypothetical protein